MQTTVHKIGNEHPSSTETFHSKNTNSTRSFLKLQRATNGILLQNIEHIHPIALYYRAFNTIARRSQIMTL